MHVQAGLAFEELENASEIAVENGMRASIDDAVPAERSQRHLLAGSDAVVGHVLVDMPGAPNQRRRTENPARPQAVEPVRLREAVRHEHIRAGMHARLGVRAKEALE